MPEGAVPRVLFYVALLFLYCLASTFAWWAGAAAARTEFRSLMSGLACSMRIFFYSICWLCILVAVKSMGFAFDDPRDPLLAWLHIGGTLWICFPSAWRAFHDRSWRLGVVVGVAWGLCAAVGALAAMASPGFRQLIERFPELLTWV